jgi:hypothetical protein
MKLSTGEERQKFIIIQEIFLSVCGVRFCDKKAGNDFWAKMRIRVTSMAGEERFRQLVKHQGVKTFSIWDAAM